MLFTRRLIGKLLISWLWLVALMTFSLGAHSNTTPKMEIVAGKPTFVLPQFSGPYSQREASIAPEEYETAERLRTMLDSDQRDAVLKELEAFYDIELSPAMLTLKAQIYFSLKMYDKAEAAYLVVLKRSPQLIRAHSDLAQLYLFKEDFKNARKYFANAVAFGSNEALIHGQLGYLNLTLHGPYSAISEYQKAMALEPENKQWQQGLLAALTQAKMYEAAQALLQELLAQRPNEPELWLNQAALALHTEDFSQAAVSLEMAILLGDTDQRNLKTAAQLHLQLGGYDRALALLEQSLAQGKLDIAVIDEYFRWLSQLGMWDKAGQLLSSVEKDVAQMSSDNRSQYYLRRAEIEAHKKNFSTAKGYYQQSLTHNPSNSNALLSYADFSATRGEFVDAELLYIRAEAIPGGEKRALLGRSQLYIEMQDYASALKQLKTTYQKFPEMVELRDNIEIIENIVRARETAGA